MILECINNLILEASNKNHTQKHMGRHKLVKRLTAQLGGNKELAVRILIKRGHLKKDGKTLTKKGQLRDNMTARERAIDRASKRSGRSPSDYTYNPKTNQATLKR